MFANDYHQMNRHGRTDQCVYSPHFSLTKFGPTITDIRMAKFATCI